MLRVANRCFSKHSEIARDCLGFGLGQWERYIEKSKVSREGFDEREKIRVLAAAAIDRYLVREKSKTP